MDDENLSNIISAASNSENELTFTESQIEAESVLSNDSSITTGNKITSIE